MHPRLHSRRGSRPDDLKRFVAANADVLGLSGDALPEPLQLREWGLWLEIGQPGGKPTTIAGHRFPRIDAQLAAPGPRPFDVAAYDGLSYRSRPPLHCEPGFPDVAPHCEPERWTCKEVQGLRTETQWLVMSRAEGPLELREALVVQKPDPQEEVEVMPDARERAPAFPTILDAHTGEDLSGLVQEQGLQVRLAATRRPEPTTPLEVATPAAVLPRPLWLTATATIELPDYRSVAPLRLEPGERAFHSRLSWAAVRCRSPAPDQPPACVALPAQGPRPLVGDLLFPPNGWAHRSVRRPAAVTGVQPGESPHRGPIGGGGARVDERGPAREDRRRRRPARARAGAARRAQRG